MSHSTTPRVQAMPIHEAPVFGDLDRAIVRRDDQLRPFLPPALDARSLKDQILAKDAHYRERSRLAALLQRQYEGIPLNPKLASNLHGLMHGDALCVVTAHQPLLFGGKGYFLYKALTAIRLAQWATGTGGRLVVPVFVLGSEDHDFEEVRYAQCFNERLTWESATGGAIGRMSQGNIPDLMDRLGELLQGLPDQEAVMRLVRASHLPGESMGRAMFRFLHELLGSYGLVVCDPDDRVAKGCMIPVFEREVRERLARTRVDPVLEKMQRAGIAPQASGRDINLFYLGEGFRMRIEAATEGRFHTPDAPYSWTEEGLIREIHEAPERFSPNVLLRPVYQQTLLPAIIFTGGGGELAYWMELGELFQAIALPYPLLARRDSVWLLDETTQHRLEKLGLDMQDMMQDQEQVIRRYVRENDQTRVDLSAEREALRELLAPLRPLCERIEPTLIRSLEAAETTMQKQLEMMETKMVRGLKHRHEQEVQQIRNLYQKLFPGGVIQERYDNFLPWLARYGPGWLDELLEAIDPLTPSLLVKRF